jgi:hypothetical protein
MTNPDEPKVCPVCGAGTTEQRVKNVLVVLLTALVLSVPGLLLLAVLVRLGRWAIG